MPSVGTYKAQPVTRKFVNTQSYPGGESGPRLFTQANVDAWVSANGSKIVNLGGMLIIPGTSAGSNFVDVVKGDNGATQLNDSGSYDPRKTMIDMGKQIVIGDLTESQLLVLRLVKTASDSETGENYNIAYVIVENNASDLDNAGGPYQVRVARI